LEVMLVTSSAKVERDALLEKSEARHSIEDLKQAEEMARQAIAKKERMEKAWHQREEERARYTDEQRSWWDEMAREAKQDANPTADRDKSAQKHGKLIDKQQKAFSEVEGAVRHYQEEFAAGKESEAKARREELEKERTSILLNRKAVEEGRQKKCDKQAKTELSKQTFEMDAMQKKLESVKAQLGEGERVNANKTRETIETRKQAEQAKKDEFGTGRFRQDEALRKDRKEMKSAKKKSTHESGMKQMTEQAQMRLAEEKAKKAKAKKDKKEFQDRLKKQEAGKELLQQHFKHEHAEQDAEHALWEAKRQADQARKWTEHKTQAQDDLKSKVGHAHDYDGGMKPQSVFTDYEMKKWGLFGTDAPNGDSQPKSLGFLGSPVGKGTN